MRQNEEISVSVPTTTDLVFDFSGIGHVDLAGLSMMLPPAAPKCLTASCEANSRPSTFRLNILWKCSAVTFSSGANS